jgi:putative DNA primase/helicase
VQPTAADELLGELNDLSSPVGAFLKECCVIGPEYEVHRATLYGAYADWAKDHGRQYVEDEAGFGRALRAAVPVLASRQHRIDGQPVRYHGGVGLK